MTCKRSIWKYCQVLLILFCSLIFQESYGFGMENLLTGIYKRITQDAAVYPGLKKTGLKLVFSDIGSFDDLIEATKQEGFLKIGLFCVIRGAFILYRRPNFNIENPEDFKIASGENRCFTPTGIESAQPIGPLALPKRNSITFFTRKNFASVGHPTALPVTRSFFASIKSSVKSLIIIGKSKWTLITAKGEKFCVRPTDYDTIEKHPICMLSDLSATKIKMVGINIVRVLRGCDNSTSVTIDVNFCTYWGAVPDVDGDGSKTLVEDDGLAGRSDDDMCAGKPEDERLLKDTLYFFKNLLIGTFDKDLVVDFNGATYQKWKLEMLDIIWDIAKMATPDEYLSDNYMNRIREFFVSELASAWRRRPDNETGNSGGNDEFVVGLLTEYDYRGLLYQTKKCLEMLPGDLSQTNWAAWEGITNPEDVDGKVYVGLRRRQGFNIVIEMTWVILNMVGGICHKVFGYAHNYWALYIHFVTNMYLAPVAELEWLHEAMLGDMNIILGGDLSIQYKKLAIFSSLALFAANSLEPFRRPLENSIMRKG